MKRVLFITITVLIGVTFSANAGMKLKLRSDLSNENTATLGNHNLETNLKLKLPAEVTNPGNNAFLKMWLIGIFADATLPLGDLGDSWSTGFSAHAMVGYMIARSILLNIAIGYTSFSEKESQEGYDNSFSWIPLLVGLNYVFNPGKKFMPFIGLALGLYFVSSSYSFTYTIFDETQTINGDASSTEFGIAPRLGAYYLVSAALLLSLTAEYNLIFSEGSSTSALGILFGAMFALR
jgi:opacity protein-like surface antigen